MRDCTPWYPARPPLRLGDEVTLRGGSGRMTISNIRGFEGYLCVWHDKDRHHQEAWYPTEALDLMAPNPLS